MIGPTMTARELGGSRPMLVSTATPGTVHVMDPDLGGRSDADLYRDILEREKARLSADGEARRASVDRYGDPLFALPDSTDVPSATLGANPALYPTGLGGSAPVNGTTAANAAITVQAGPLELAVLGVLLFVAIKVL